MDKGNKRRDWIDILAKLLPGAGAIIAGILIPLVIHINSEKNRNNQLYAEIVSKREISDSELRAKMFENLIKSFFSNVPQQTSNIERITLLRLIALNFHEFFDLKPLFEELESQLRDNEIEKLRGIASEIVGKQEAQLSSVNEGMVYEETLYEGWENGKMIPPGEKEPYKGHRLGIEIVEIGENDNYAKLSVKDIPEGKDAGDNVNVKFKLGYYDLPFIDNTKLFNSTRFTIILKKILKDEHGKKAVNIKIIFFPESYMTSRDRPYLDEMLGQLMKSKR